MTDTPRLPDGRPRCVASLGPGEQCPEAAVRPWLWRCKVHGEAQVQREAEAEQRRRASEPRGGGTLGGIYYPPGTMPTAQFQPTRRRLP